jgi:hypothetical protein
MALTALCFAPLGRAQIDGTESLIVTFNAQQMRRANGRTAGLDWVGRFDAGVLSIGAHSSDVGPSQWSVLGVGGSRPVGEKRILSGRLDIGPGSTDGQAFTFKKLHAALSFPVSPRLTLTAYDTFVDVAPVSGHLIGGGARLTGDKGRSLQMQVAASAGGNLDEQSFSTRLDYRATPPYFMAGLVLSRSNNALLLNIPGTEAVNTRLRQGFAGATLPLRRTELTIALEAAKIGDSRRYAVTVAVRLRLDRPE